ncbi:MAG: protein kinase [Polyangiaceae bacterium]
MAPREGDFITENVRLVRLLGKGGMGSVWVARHESLDVDVAVKFVSPELLSDGDALVLERFRREAKLAAKIESPHVVRIFDHGVTKDGVPYIVMELLRGESVAERLVRTGRFAPKDAARVVKEVAAGLSRAHAMGVVHRDIKPHNVYLAKGSDGLEIVKILDFGIAKATSAAEELHKEVKTSSGVLIGTPQYMSPEQLMRAGPPDASADLWALAILAYELLTGKVPFLGETLAATLVAITRAQMTPPSTSVPEVPVSLDAFFARALAIDNDKRFPAATDLARAFEDAAGGVAPPPPVTTTTMTRPVISAPVPDDLSTAEFVARTQDKTAEQSVLLTESGPRSGPGVEFASTEVGLSKAATRSTKTAASEAVPASTGVAQRSDSASHSATLQSAGSTPPKKSSPMKLVVGLAAGVVVIGLAAFVAGQNMKKPVEPVASQTTVAPTGSAPIDPTASAPTNTPTVAPSASEAPPPKITIAPAFKKQVVKDGFVGDSKLWVPDFWISRDTEDAGKAYLAAVNACHARKMSLCTEAQFDRACATYSEVGQSASWTLTSDSGGFVVRGGEGGCATRTIVTTDDLDASRAAPCCTRSVSILTPPNFQQLRNTSNRITVYENNFNLGNGDRIAKDALSPVGFFEQKLDKDKLKDAVNWVSKTIRVVEDRCDIALVPRVGEGVWTAACTGLEFDLVNPDPSQNTHPDRLDVKGVKQVFHKFEFDPGGLLRDVRTWTHPRRLIMPE